MIGTRVEPAPMAIFGAGLVVVYTGLISSADAITKLIAGGYAAPQMFAISGLIVVALSLLADRHPRQRLGLRTSCPRAMALRSGATVIAAVCFFNAFRLLPFAEVFVFIGLMPLLAGLMSGFVLGEPLRPAIWIALAAGFVGVLCLFPGGLSAITPGHSWAILASVSGTFSMIMARYIGRFETNALAQVFYPNAALCLSMALVLPMVWVPMSLGDLAWIVAYAFCLFLARWLLVISLRLLPAYVVTPLMNLQFVWMVILGALAFQEVPDAGIFMGVAIVVASGLYLLWDQLDPASGRARSSG